jgi:hypothetical protein
MQRRGAGLTVLEALAATALAGIVAATASATLVELVRTARLAGAVRAVATSLRHARGRALAGAAPVEVRFALGGAAWEVRDGGGGVETRTLPPGLFFASLPARGRILFGGVGGAENGTIVVAAGERARSVVVNQRGRVRLP